MGRYFLVVVVGGKQPKTGTIFPLEALADLEGCDA
jgi:hypothetical protein